MLRLVTLTLVLFTLPAGATAQSLFVRSSERAIEGSAGWSVGPSSTAVETHGAVSLDGRWDVGLGFNRYNVDLGDSDSPYTEFAPFARYFLFKEDEDAVPVSLAAHAQYFTDNFEGDDSGWYVVAGATVFKCLTMTDTFALYPYIGFSLAGESFTFGSGPAERAIYLTRLLGIHGLITLTDGTWLRVSVEEDSYRLETYRALRAAIIRRF